ncbi:MAG: hypothetical protein HYU97_11115 [Deltaproteobacteria bacterium]|nr:hypothetical protein [Deltaproteobacteria bacterium]
MKNKIKDKFVPLEPSNSTKHLDLTKMQKAPDMPELKASTVTVNLRMPLSLLNELKIQANKRDVPYQSYMKMLLAQSLGMHSQGR